MIKTLIYNLPPLDILRPPLSGAILASLCKQQGHHVEAVDLQQELIIFLKNTGKSIDLFNDVFYEHSPSFSSEQIQLLNEFISHELAKRHVDKFNYILISFFSHLAQSFGNEFLPILREHTSSKIVIGGAGLVGKRAVTDLVPGGLFHYPSRLKSAGVIDEYITGEAEEALINYFNGQVGPGIGNDKFKQIDDLDAQPWPDFSYYNLNNYDQFPKEIPIIGSRGCVRKCTFCDVVRTSPKYRYRSGRNIADEIIHHYETHGITHFYFTDSLVNGSFKAFNDMCEHLSAYNFREDIKWSGQYIIRPEQHTPANHFDNLKASGCETLFIGIESGADRVRFDLGKKFTNNDIEFYLKNFAERDIKVLFLMFSGYVGETKEDHAETLSMFPRWQKYVATGTIQGIETLNILSVLPGTPLEKIAQENQFLFLTDEKNNILERSWIDPRQPNYDFIARVQNHIEMIETAIKYNWPLWNGLLSATLYEESVASYKKIPKKFIPISALSTK
jgi:radical SAM superfamily enzyme YgiQ (UPF0313 family)